MMTILINGEERTVKERISVADLLKSYQIDPAVVVVEHNETVLSKQLFGETLMSAGDKIEIVRFVGGGS